MFSKLKKNSKTEKPTQYSKLRGMPALKQMRSWKREADLSVKAKTGMPSLSERPCVNETDLTRYTRNEMVQSTRTVDLIITPSYQRPPSPPASKDQLCDSRRPIYIDRSSTGNGSDVVPSGIAHDILLKGDEDVDDESAVINSPWRISKGDSGYKSKDDGKKNSMTKQKRSRRRTNSGKRSATSGLLDIKQQRKASRDSLSQSMRALTPKERESIQFLEDVLKNLPDGDESLDEVFDSESSEHEDDVIEIHCKRIDEDEEQAIDYGYASVNDISRRFSVDSMESVGSIIDLVGNLSTSPLSETSPLYAVVNFSKKNRDVTEVDDIIKTTGDDVIISRNVVAPEDMCEDILQHDCSAVDLTQPRSSGDVITNPEDAITHLDDVINSFSFQTDEEEQEEKSEVRSERKEKRIKRRKSKDRDSDSEKEIKKRERKKNRDSEKEKERKERKKKRKEEKRGKNGRERSDENDEARRREENIARHVDEITALTQDMIKTAQREEPVYAQVKKPIKIKDINENFGMPQEMPEPPAPFGNSTTSEEHEKRPESSERGHNFSMFKLTSTPVAPSGSRHRIGHTSLQEVDIEMRKAQTPTPKRPVSDSTQYAHIIQPGVSKCDPQPNGRVHVSESMLQQSSRNLKHVDAHLSTGKSIQVNAGRNGVDETAEKTPTVTPGSPKPTQNFYRNPGLVRGNPRPGRPVSLNLPESDNASRLTGEKKASVYAYASFRLERSEPKGDTKAGQKPRPFVITTVKKPIQLC